MALCMNTSITPARPPDKRTVYMRELPATLHALDSATGKRLFTEALLEGGMAGYFRLAQQFHTQADPAYCGLGSLVCALNALGIDPARPWKGPWRWFSEELLDCCKSLDDVKRFGLTLEEVACLARCSTAEVEVHRPGAEVHRPGVEVHRPGVESGSPAGLSGPASVEVFREHLRASATNEGGPVLIVNYSRQALGQTGDGHFSPVAGFHAEKDLALVLDTARFKYPPHWVPVEQLFSAMEALDGATGLVRGWLLMSPEAPR